ncbi:MAG: nuclear transport factor 2 family protein [Verrucomicrobia bacterium]|nr:nuclear transport factor 2 family protein [Verrucomicrobiota bacterium]MDA1065973.1 nuclear transport factor 2 family protein [Verrucomicrobiota bacterium]
MSAEENKAAVLAAYNGFAEGNMKPLMSILAENVEWSNYEDNPLNGTYHGPAGVESFFAKFEEMEFTGFQIVTLMAEGDRVVSALDASYTVKSTGKSASGIAMHLLDFRDGKVIRFQEVAATSVAAWR